MRQLGKKYIPKDRFASKVTQNKQLHHFTHKIFLNVKAKIPLNVRFETIGENLI